MPWSSRQGCIHPLGAQVQREVLGKCPESVRHLFLLNYEKTLIQIIHLAVKSLRPMKQVLEEGLLPFYEPRDPSMQDSMRVHVQGGSPARVKWFQTQSISAVDWSVHSPHLNYIEHVWNLLQREINRLEPEFANFKAKIIDDLYARELSGNTWSSCVKPDAQVDSIPDCPGD